MGRKNHTEAVDTAMHIVKGAIVQVLATPVTKSTQYNNKTNGRISVVYESDVAPTDAQVQDIVAKANAMVQKNVAVTDKKCARAEAEQSFSKSIYDLTPIPDSVTEVNVVSIDGCTANCCPGGHLKTTGEVGPISVPRFNFRPQKKEVEFIVTLGEPAAAGGAKKGKGKQTKKAAKGAAAVEVPRCKSANEVAASVVDLVLAEVKQSPDADPAAVKAAVLAAVATELNSLKNLAYASGFQSGRANILNLAK